jgi:hypothetical protein
LTLQIESKSDEMKNAAFQANADKLKQCILKNVGGRGHNWYECIGVLTDKERKREKGIYLTWQKQSLHHQKLLTMQPPLMHQPTAAG